MPGTTSNGMPGLAQQQRLLAAAAEHERVAALEPHHAAAGAGVLEQERVRVLLGICAPAPSLPT